MYVSKTLLFSIAFFPCFIIEPVLTWPESISPIVLTNSDCSSPPTKNASEEINVLIRDTINPKLNSQYGPPCKCGGTQWTNVVDINMADTSQTCPSNWTLTTSVRGCERVGRGCSSAIFPVNREYSEVCGRVDAIQYGGPDAFDNYLRLGTTLEGDYLDGISLTHGSPGSRQHIWSFVTAISEMATLGRVICPCTNSSLNWDYILPQYVGNNYFCDTGNRGPGVSQIYYTEDPLWDGQGCGPTSTCCRLHNPPWFCAKLPRPTSDDLEIRICANNGPSNEETVVTKVEIYVQ